MSDDFRARNARLAKPHSYKIGDSVLLSTKHINLSLPCKKLSPAFVGPFGYVRGHGYPVIREKLH